MHSSSLLKLEEKPKCRTGYLFGLQALEEAAASLGGGLGLCVEGLLGLDSRLFLCLCLNRHGRHLRLVGSWPRLLLRLQSIHWKCQGAAAKCRFCFSRSGGVSQGREVWQVLTASTEGTLLA